MTTFAYTGCRTTRERNARGEGIGVYAIGEATGEWTRVQILETDPNPSFLALHPALDVLYAVHGDHDLVSAYAVEPATGRIRPIGKQSTLGTNPVHLALDATHRWLVVPNYKTDSIVSLPVSPDGALGPVVHKFDLEGPLGPHRTEQNYGRPHHAPFSPSGKWIVVPEKGFDRIVTLVLDAQTGILHEASRVACRETSGPRHISFHPHESLAYVLNELDSTVTTYRFFDEDGRLEPFDIVSSLPRNFVGNSRASEITISSDGRHLYASNRGHDSIAVFAIGPDGTPESQGWAATQGSTPRFFALDPREEYLYAANEDTDSIVQFRRKPSGALVPTGYALATGSPTVITFKTV